MSVCETLRKCECGLRENLKLRLPVTTYASDTLRQGPDRAMVTAAGAVETFVVVSCVED